MTFAAPFSRVITRPFGGVPSKAWWLSGGIAAANCIAAYQPKGAASLAASYANLTGNATYNAAEGTAPSWDATSGWIFNAASTQYLLTNYVLTSTSSVIVKFSDASGATCVVGCSSNAKTLFEIGTARFRVGSVTITVTTYSGVLAVAGITCFKDASSLGDGTDGRSVLTLDIGRRRTGASTGDRYFTGYIQALAIYNSDVTANISALTTAMNAL